MCLVASGDSAQRLGAAWWCTCRIIGQANPFPSQAPLLPWATMSSRSARALLLLLSRDVIQEGQLEPQPEVFSGYTRRQPFRRVPSLRPVMV